MHDISLIYILNEVTPVPPQEPQYQAWETSIQLVGHGSPSDSQNNVGYCCCTWLPLRD